MSALRQKLKEMNSAFVESFRAIVWGQFFRTSLQTQLSILQLLRNLFLRVGMIDSHLRSQEYTFQKVITIIDGYLKSVNQRIDNICLLEKKVIDHLEVLLRCTGIAQENMQLGHGDSNIWENHLIEFLLPWVEDKTAIHLGAHQENLGETMLKIGFKRSFAFELNFEGILPASAGLLKVDGGEHNAEIFERLPKDSNYQIIMYGFQNRNSSELSQQEKIVRYLRDLNYPFSISLINHRDKEWQFAEPKTANVSNCGPKNWEQGQRALQNQPSSWVANMPPRIMDAWGSTLCFRDSALFEKAYVFMNSQMPVKRG